MEPDVLKTQARNPFTALRIIRDPISQPAAAIYENGYSSVNRNLDLFECCQKGIRLYSTVRLDAFLEVETACSG